MKVFYPFVTENWPERVYSIFNCDCPLEQGVDVYIEEEMFWFRLDLCVMIDGGSCLTFMCPACQLDYDASQINKRVSDVDFVEYRCPASHLLVFVERILLEGYKRREHRSSL